MTLVTETESTRWSMCTGFVRGFGASVVLPELRHHDYPDLLRVSLGGMYNRSPRFIHVCRACRRSFKDESVKDVNEWMTADLDAEIRPGYEMVWDRRVKMASRA